MKKCSGIRCPYTHDFTKDCPEIDKCEYFTSELDSAELLDIFLNVLANKIVEKLKEGK